MEAGHGVQKTFERGCFQLPVFVLLATLCPALMHVWVVGIGALTMEISRRNSELGIILPAEIPGGPKAR